MEGLSQSYQEYAENLKQKFNHVSRTVLQLQRMKQEHQKCWDYTETWQEADVVAGTASLSMQADQLKLDGKL